MTRLGAAKASVAALVFVGVTLPAASSHASRVDIWFVRVTAGAGGAGTAARPFDSLAAAASASRPGDTIVVLPSARALTGGIALKPGQTLRGAGAAVTSLAASAPAPTLTNTSRSRLDGDALRLADGVTVRNLRIAGTSRGGIYGRDVSGVTITGTDVSGQNASCTKGFLIPGFNLPTNVPGVGVPLPTGLQNGWARRSPPRCCDTA